MQGYDTLYDIIGEYMARKILFIGICSLFAVLVLLLSGCPTGGGESDEWMLVTSLDELKGTWEGSTVVDIPEIPLKSILEANGIPQDTLMLPGVPEVLVAAPLDYNIKMIVNDTEMQTETTINCQRYLETTMGNIAPMVWFLLKTNFDESPDILLTNDYKIIVTASSPIGEGDDEITSSGFYINQNKNKLKIPFEEIFANEEIFLDEPPSGLTFHDLILEKK
jgi:hypothetical protein